MQTQEKSFLGTVAIIVVSVVLAVMGAMLLLNQLSARRTAAAVKSSVQYRTDEIKALQKLLEEDIADAQKQGKTPADIEEMKAKYQASINKLQVEIETIQAGGQVETP